MNEMLYKYICNRILVEMGTLFSVARDVAIQYPAFQPPQCGYHANNCEMTHDENHLNVPLMLFTPESDVHQRTRQRWKARKSYDDNEKPMLIFSHGNADDCESCRLWCQWMSDRLEVNIVSYDYHGYGLAHQSLTTDENMKTSLHAIFDLLHRQMSVPKNKIFLIGKSIGTVPTINFGRHKDASNIGGVILISPLASGIRVLFPNRKKSFYFQNSLDSLSFPSIERINYIKVPIFVVHGKMDEIIDISNAYALHNKLSEESKFEPLYVQAGHNDIEALYSEIFLDEISKFILHASSKVLSQKHCTPYEHDIDDEYS